MLGKIRKQLFVAIFSIAFVIGSVMIGSVGMVFADTGGLPADYGTLDDDYTGKTVILQSNDVHGAINDYQHMAGLRDELKKRGADVYMVDSGDYLQGSIYVSWDKGVSAIKLMDATGYDLATVGNHEFDYTYKALKKLLETAQFKVICDDIVDKHTGKKVFDSTHLFTNGDLKIGFFGIDTPQTQTTSRPVNTAGLKFLTDKTRPKIFQQAKADVKSLHKKGADIVIGLTHLGVDVGSKPYRSYDLWKQLKGTGTDLLLDGHSHTVMTAGENGEPIMSTGTKFANIGVVVIDEKTEKIEKRFLYKVSDITWSNSKVKAMGETITETVDKMYQEKIGVSDEEMNGCKDAADAKATGKPYANGNRDGETNLGDLAADALRACALRSIKEGEKYDVDEDHIVGMINGGSIRACIPEGDVSKENILEAFPFMDSVHGIYVKGSTLLEVLEASSYDTPDPAGAFSQVCGIDYTIDTRYAFYPRPKPYPRSTFYGPKYIRRVHINNINGKPFRKKDTYLIMTVTFCATGGDMYYPYTKAGKTFDTGILNADALITYIQSDLKGVIGKQYAQPAGRITIRTGSTIKTDNPMTVKCETKKVSLKKLKKKSRTVKSIKVRHAEGKLTFEKTGGSPKLAIGKTGKVRVKKGAEKGLYKIRATVRAAGNEYCKPKTVHVTAKVRVR